MASISLGVANDLHMGAVTWFIVRLFGLHKIFGSLGEARHFMFGRHTDGIPAYAWRIKQRHFRWPCHVQGHPHIACIFKCDFSNSATAVGKTSTDLQRRAVPLRLAYIAAENNYVTEQRVSAARLIRCYVYVMSVLQSVTECLGSDLFSMHYCI